MTLVEAIQIGDLEKVQSLLEENSSLIDSQTDHGISILLFALYCQKKDIVNLLLEKKKQFDFFEAAATGQLDFLEQRLNENPAFLNQFSTDGFTGLGLASFFSQKESVNILLAKGADPNIPSNNDFKVTPLHSATAAGQYEIVRILLENNADPNAKQQKDVTPLHSAAHLGKKDIIEILLKFDADKTAKTIDGKIPFDFIPQSELPEIAPILK